MIIREESIVYFPSFTLYILKLDILPVFTSGYLDKNAWLFEVSQTK